MLVIKPLWVTHVPQDATGYSGELRSKADVRSYKNKMTYANAYATFCKLFYFCRDFAVFSGH